MRIAVLDPFAGISGDMTLGALLSAGLDPSWLERLPQRLGLDGIKVKVSRVDRCSVSATKVDFEIPGGARDTHHHEHRHGHSVDDLIQRIERSDLTRSVKARATRAFELLSEAEGSVHGVAPTEVHLHEVGAADALLDIVGGIEGFERLGVEAIYNLPVAMGDGWVDAAHGKLPVPAPASVLLLKGVVLRSAGPVSGEAVTPTGAALLRVLSQGAPPTMWRVSGVGWGAGKRDPAEYPNALRLILGEVSAEGGVVDVVATDIDDLAPEYVGPLRDAVVSAGALDCQVWATHGKKGRVSLRLEALVAPEVRDSVAAAIFANSTTIGVRSWSTTRNTLSRRELEVEPRAGFRVRVKVSRGPQAVRIKAEFDDVERVANELGIPALDIAREAEELAEELLRKQKTVLD